MNPVVFIFSVILGGLIAVMPKRTITWLSFILIPYITIDYLYKSKNISDSEQLENELRDYTHNQFLKLQKFDELNTFTEIIGLNNKQCEPQSHNILIIAGNGHGAFGRGQLLRHIKALKAHGAHSVTVVGDGASDINIQSILDVSKLLRHDTRPVTVIIMAHGLWADTDDGHLINLAGHEHDKLTDTCELLKQIKNELGSKKELSFFLESCFGGRAIQCASTLGNSAASLAGKHNIIFGLFHIDGFIQALESSHKQKNGDLSARKLLEMYLLQPNGFRLATLNLFSPMYASHKVAAINLRDSLNSLEATQINYEIEDLLHNKFDPLMGANEVSRNLDAISYGNSFYNNWINGDIGKSLLFSLEIQEKNSIHRSENDHQDSYNKISPKLLNM